ncbi:MAG: hypothetical protein WDW36_006338 [Sanguina aurantia]
MSSDRKDRSQMGSEGGGRGGFGGGGRGEGRGGGGRGGRGGGRGGGDRDKGGSGGDRGGRGGGDAGGSGDRESSKSSKDKSIVDHSGRRTWDKTEYQQKADEREKADDEAEESALDARKRKRLARDPLHNGLIVQRTELQGRQYQIDLASRLGKTQVVGLNTPLNQQAGYFCSVCDCILRDSQSYLDHINGKWHNRALGMNMRVERVSVDKVKAKLDELKAKLEATASKPEEYLPDGYDRRLLEAEEAEAREKEQKRDQKRDKKLALKQHGEEEEEEEEGGMDPDMMALMGFGGFGTSSRK